MTTHDTNAAERGASSEGKRGLHRREFAGLLAALAAPGAAGTAAGQSAADERVAELVDRLTLSEKIGLTHGDSGQHTGHIDGIDRVGIPDVDMLDGPVGVRTEDERPATAFPASVASAASFDPSLQYEQGRAMAREAKSFGVQALLGPALNIQRVPTGGRVFEYYSEDPRLTGEMAASATRGIQAEDVVATAKHFVVNSFETNRETVSAEVSERALREIYLPAFHRALGDGGARAVMSAYNAVNGENCSANEFLLRQVLSEEWEFDGYVVSDWDAIQDSVAAANAGLDLDMPGAGEWGQDYFNEALRPAVDSGEVSEERLDEMVRNVLRPFAETGHLDGSIGSGERNTDAHQDLAREIAEQGATLLKNDGDVLPIEVDEVDSVGVVGPLANEAKVGGGGAAAVVPPHAVDPVSAIRDYVGGDVEVREGEDAGAFDADVVLAFGRVHSEEFEDRQDMRLETGDDAIQRAADRNPNTVAVLRIPGPVVMPWLDDVAGVLSTWYPGMEDGRATANVLFGETTPSGKLPTTFGASFEDYPVSQQRRFPGEDGRAHYDEGVFVGYRHFDAEGIDPTFEFGFGLSYTTFEYADVTATERWLQPDVEGADPTFSGVDVDVEVENTGEYRGGEAVQVYVEHVDPSVPRPPMELKKFGKVWLDPGESGTVSLSLTSGDFRYWDPDSGGWTLEEGEYRIHVAASSRDVRETRTVVVDRSGEPSGPPAVGDNENAPTDPDGDELYEDVNGNGDGDLADAVDFFQHRESEPIAGHRDAYDFSGNEEVDLADVVQLFEENSG